MSQENNEKKSLTLNEELQKLNESLDKFEQEINLPPIKPVEEIEKYLNMERTELKALSPVDCAEIKFLINREALNIQRVLNRQNTMANWLSVNLDIRVASLANNFGDNMVAYIQKRGLVLKHDEISGRMSNILLAISSRAERLNSISEKIIYLAKSLDELRQTKIREITNNV